MRERRPEVTGKKNQKGDFIYLCWPSTAILSDKILAIEPMLRHGLLFSVHIAIFPLP